MFTYSHNNQPHTNPRTQPLSHARSFPERRHKIRVFVSVHDPREDVVCVGGGADCEQDYEEEGVEVEEGGLVGGLVCGEEGWGGEGKGEGGRTILIVAGRFRGGECLVVGCESVVGERCLVACEWRCRWSVRWIVMGVRECDCDCDFTSIQRNITHDA